MKSFIKKGQTWKKKPIREILKSKQYQTKKKKIYNYIYSHAFGTVYIVFISGRKFLLLLYM